MTVLGGNSQVFDTLSERLSGTFRKLTGKAVLSEENIQDALREVRRALLEADVALAVRESACGRPGGQQESESWSGLY